MDNNLYYLEAIHNFVEVLNEYFHNVCELDLVFNFYKVSELVAWIVFKFKIQVYTVVDEMFLAGEIRETSQTKVLKQLMMLTSLEWHSRRSIFFIDCYCQWTLNQPFFEKRQEYLMIIYFLLEIVHNFERRWK